MGKEKENDKSEDYSYESAVEALYSSVHQSQSASAIEKAALRRTRTISDMHHYLRRVGVSLDGLRNIIHITGTKGKGSVAYLCDEILRSQEYRTGLFTSPHLMDIRERIRVNGRPISKDGFASVYWTLRHRLESHSIDNEGSEDEDGLPFLPGYFRMLTLMALYAFLHPPSNIASTPSPPLDVIILEVGMGGRYDATNLFDFIPGTTNLICGVTLIDYDHTRVLGSTLEAIAYEKAGIFRKHKIQPPQSQSLHNDDYKPQSQSSQQHQQHSSSLPPRLFATASNTSSVLQVLQQCALEEETLIDTHNPYQQVHIVQTNHHLPSHWNVGLAGNHQRSNAAMALALCRSMYQFMNSNHQQQQPWKEQVVQCAIAQASWPGRCQTIVLPSNPNHPCQRTTLRLDGAHTPQSIKACMKWFFDQKNITTATKRILLFHCGHERDPIPLLQSILENDGLYFHSVYFCTTHSTRPSSILPSKSWEFLQKAGILPLSIVEGKEEETTWQETLSQLWKTLESHYHHNNNDDNNHHYYCAKRIVNKTVEQALLEIQDDDEATETSIEVCISGSLYIVGSVLKAICWDIDQNNIKAVVDTA